MPMLCLILLAHSRWIDPLGRQEGGVGSQGEMARMLFIQDKVMETSVFVCSLLTAPFPVRQIAGLGGSGGFDT